MSSVSGSDKADMDDVTACRENMGIIGKVGGSGSIPITGSGAEGEV